MYITFEMQVVREVYSPLLFAFLPHDAMLSSNNSAVGLDQFQLDLKIHLFAWSSYFVRCVFHDQPDSRWLAETACNQPVDKNDYLDSKKPC